VKYNLQMIHALRATGRLKSVQGGKGTLSNGVLKEIVKYF
jgi:hypothetical protein